MNHFVCVLLLLGLSSALANPLTGRIVGGEDAKKGEFPHQVSMKFFGSHMCGGSIISNNVILSAAHCVKGMPASYLTISAGSISTGSSDQTRSVKSFIYHEKYDASSIDYDVSLLFLKEPLQFNELVQPIQLATERPADGTTVTVTGWGTTKENGAASSLLQKVDVKVVDNDKCNGPYDGKITDRMMCAGVDAGGKDACQGDSGGPLIQGNKQVGIVSWGYGCARAGVPGVYSAVNELHSWIYQNSGIGGI